MKKKKKAANLTGCIGKQFQNLSVSVAGSPFQISCILLFVTSPDVFLVPNYYPG